MKRFLILLMCLLLALPVAGQAKTFDYTIQQLIVRQLQTGVVSMRVKFSAAAEGEAVAGIDAQTWEMMKGALPPLQLTCTYMQSKYGAAAGKQQIKGTLTQNEEALTSFSLTSQNEKWFLQSDLLPGKVYALSRNLKTAFMNMTAPEEDAWPNILRLFTAVSEADEEDSAQLEEAMSEHMASLNRWLQGYTKVDITADQQLIQEIRVPAADVKQQMKAFLKELYADEELLVLLRKVVPTPDAHAYLEGGMLPLFEKAIDGLQLEGEVAVSRSYDGSGQLKQEEITLPFAGGMPLRTLTIANGDQMAVKAALADGSVYAITLSGSLVSGNGMFEGMYKGEISLQPAAAEKAFEALYSLKLKKGMEQYIEENKSHERDQLIEAELTLLPKEEGAFAGQKISAAVHLTAGASSTKAAYADTELIWQDLETNGKLSLTVKLHTNTALRIDEVEEALSVQMDTESAASREELFSDAAALLQENLSVLIGKILQTPALP